MSKIINDTDLAVKDTNVKAVNPFEQGVTYEQFLKALPEKITIKEYLKDLCTEDEIAWIETEIENYNLNKTTN